MIEFAATCVQFGDRTIIDHLDLRIERGRTTVLLGRSGSGKTTLLRLINRMLLPSAGDVIVDGTSTAAWDPIELRRRTGYVIQDGGLLPHYTVGRNVGLVPELAGWSADRIAARVDELLALVGLPPDEFAGRLPHQLSGGQRQRVGVARALAAHPPLLLCDEPFGALDPITRHELQVELRRLARSLEVTIAFVTHDVGEALTLADRIILLATGRVVVDADPAGFRASDHPEAIAFLDSVRAPPEQTAAAEQPAAAPHRQPGAAAPHRQP